MRGLTFDKLVNIILIVTILFLSLCSSPKVEVNQGMSEQEHLYRLEVFKIGLENERLHNEINNFKTAIIKDSVFIHNATNNQIDSLFTSYLGQP
jgi:hypothetical protein